MSSQILLYSGPGASDFCTQALENQLRDICDDRIHRISAIQSFSSWSDPESIKALFIPGGNAAIMFFGTDLSEVALRVKEAIDRYKIAYYGACAGGIIASSSFHDRASPEKVQNGFLLRDHRFLSLFPGEVVAPLFANPRIENRKFSLEDFRVQNIEIIQSVGNKFLQCGHVLSPAYLNVDKIEGAQILAKYTNLEDFHFYSCREREWQYESLIHSAGMSESVFYQRSNGPSVLLTGSHPEIGSQEVLFESFKDAFHSTNEEQRQLADSLQECDSDRKSLLKGYFEKIGIVCK